jgi:hypothetical protein
VTLSVKYGTAVQIGRQGWGRIESMQCWWRVAELLNAGDCSGFADARRVINALVG